MRPQTLARPTPLMAARAVLSYCTPAPPPRCAGTSKIFLQRRVWEACTRRQQELPHLAHISPISRTYLPYISPYISTTSPPVSPQELLRVIGCRASFGMPFTSRGLCRVVIHRRLRDFVRYTRD